jgi:hypothetical protein
MKFILFSNFFPTPSYLYLQLLYQFASEILKHRMSTFVCCIYDHYPFVYWFLFKACKRLGAL